MDSSSDGTPDASRPALRRSLLAEREKFVTGPAFEPAAAALARHLGGVLKDLEPGLLGLYWQRRSEFNAVGALASVALFTKWPLALPFVQRTPPQMHYRAWDGMPPAGADECGILTGGGAPVLPDVVLVPCVGYAAGGYRLGYGGGYFDRWLAQHPDVTAVGVAWRVGHIAPGAFSPRPHDIPLALVVTEDGVV